MIWTQSSIFYYGIYADVGFWMFIQIKIAEQTFTELNQ